MTTMFGAASRSSVGAMVTHRSVAQSGAGANQAYGVDASLGLLSNLDVTGFWAATHTDGVSDEGRSYQLALDSNADCVIDGVRNENITWLQDAPVGTYTVRLDLFDDCGSTPTNYVVTVQVAGQPTQVYTGTLTGPSNFGGPGDGIEIATFEVSAG